MKAKFSPIVATLLLILAAGCISKTPASLPAAPTQELILTPTYDSGGDIAEPAEIVITATPATAAPVALTPPLLPVLSAEDASAEVRQLLQGDPECRFPCFWGLEPGKTSIADTTAFLDKFENIGSLNISEKMGSVHLRTPIGAGVRLGVYIDLAAENQNLDRLSVGLALEKEQQAVEFIHDKSLLAEILPMYQLSQILHMYGPPSDVRILTYQAVPLGDLQEFHLLLVYPQAGFMLMYTASVGDSPLPTKPDRDVIPSCFSDAYLHLWLWQPSEAITADNALKSKIGNASFFAEFKPIEAVTDFDTFEFYETFKDPESSHCLTPPVEFWPLP